MKLFRRIFLTFWLCTGLMAAAVLSANEFLSLRFPDDPKAAFHPEAAQASLAEAVNVYEKRGKTALKEYLQDLALSRYMRPYLVNEDGTMLAASGAPPPIYARLAREALQDEGADLERFFGSRFLTASQLPGLSTLLEDKISSSKGGTTYPSSGPPQIEVAFSPNPNGGHFFPNPATKYRFCARSLSRAGQDRRYPRQSPSLPRHL